MNLLQFDKPLVSNCSIELLTDSSVARIPKAGRGTTMDMTCKDTAISPRRIAPSKGVVLISRLSMRNLFWKKQKQGRGSWMRVVELI